MKRRPTIREDLRRLCEAYARGLKREGYGGHGSYDFAVPLPPAEPQKSRPCRKCGRGMHSGAVYRSAAGLRRDFWCQGCGLTQRIRENR